MSAVPALDASRAAAQSSILRRFAEVYERAEGMAAQRAQDPEMRRLAAGRIALEYAVMKTAMEKDTPMPTVAGALQAAPAAVQADLVRQGQAAMRTAYGQDPDLIAAAMAGKVVDVPMPKGFANNPEFDRLIDSARNLVAASVQEVYANRGRLAIVPDRGSDRNEVVALQAKTGLASTRADLAARLAFLDSAIDAWVSRAQMSQANATMLKERVEAFVFQPRPPQSLSYTKEFTDFYQREGQDMRVDVMTEVRAVTSSRTVQEIAAKVDSTLRPPGQQPPVRAQPGHERD